MRIICGSGVFSLVAESQEPKLKASQESIIYIYCKCLCPLRVSNFARFQNINISFILQGLVKSNSAHPMLSPQHNCTPRSPLTVSPPFKPPLTPPLSNSTKRTRSSLILIQLGSTLSTTVLNNPQPGLSALFCGKTIPGTPISIVS